MSRACTHVHVHTEAHTHTQLSNNTLCKITSDLYFGILRVWGDCGEQNLHCLCWRVHKFHTSMLRNWKRTEACNCWTESLRKGERLLILVIRQFALLLPRRCSSTLTGVSDQLQGKMVQRKQTLLGGEKKDEQKTDRMRPSSPLSLRHYLFPLFVDSQIDFRLGAIRAVPLLLGNECHSFVRGHTWAFLFKGNFTMWQPCMTKCQGSEGGSCCCTVCFWLPPIIWPTFFFIIRDAPIPMPVSVPISKVEYSACTCKICVRTTIGDTSRMCIHIIILLNLCLFWN